MTTVALEGRREDFFGHVSILLVSTPVPEPGGIIIQQLVVLRLVVGA